MSLALVGDKGPEIHRRVGRNLLQFQLLEVNLKLVLPYMVREGERRTAEEVRARTKDMRRWTLGRLFEEFEKLAVTSEGFWLLTPDEVVDARNDLVHRFFHLEAIDHLSPDAFEQAVRYLDEQFEAVQEMAAYLSMSGLQLSRQLLRNKSDRTPEEERWLPLLEEATVPGMELIDTTLPPAMAWRNTRVVELLKRAERETEPVDGYTLLSRAGALLRREDPIGHQRRYGLKRLSDVLRICGLFEVDEQIGKGGEKVVRYRSVGSPRRSPLNDELPRK